MHIHMDNLSILGKSKQVGWRPKILTHKASLDKSGHVSGTKALCQQVDRASHLWTRAFTTEDPDLQRLGESRQV